MGLTSSTIMPTPMRAQERKQFKVCLTLYTNALTPAMSSNTYACTDRIRRRNDLRKLCQRHWQRAEAVSRYAILAFS